MASRNTPYLDEVSSAFETLEGLWDTIQDSDLDVDIKRDACCHIEDAIEALENVARLL